MFIMLTFTFVNETLISDDSNDRYLAVLFSGNVYCVVHGLSNFELINETPLFDHSNESV